MVPLVHIHADPALAKSLGLPPATARGEFFKLALDCEVGISSLDSQVFSQAW